MSEQADNVAIFEAEDGILLIGSDRALAEVDGELDSRSTSLSAKTLARVAGQLGDVVATASANSGRWLKLTDDSAQQLKRWKGTSVGADGLLAGVLRDDRSKFVHQLKFTDLSKGGLLTPAAPAVLGSIATQYALESALDDITAYLEVIDEKLDRLLKQRKVEALGQLGGVALAIDEAYDILAQTGVVSAITWSKVQATPLALSTMQAEALAQLHEVATDITTTSGDTDKAAKVLERGREDAEFWLGVLARTIALQDRQSYLELERVADEDLGQLEAHRRGIVVARHTRLRRIAAALEAIGEAVTTASELTNRAKVANPLTAPRVARRANALTANLARFAQHVELDLAEMGTVAQTPWSRAARGLLSEASDAVGAAKDGSVERARALTSAVHDRRSRAANRKAGKARKLAEHQGPTEGD